MVFYWSLSNNMTSQVSGTLSSILADLNNTVAWMVSTPLSSKSFTPCTSPLVTIPRAPITIGIYVTIVFCSFFNSLVKSKYLLFFSLSFNFILWSTALQSPQLCKISSLFLLIIIRSGRLAEIRWSICISCQRSFILQDRFWIVYIPFVRIVKFKFLAVSSRSPCLVLYSFCANLLHSLIMTYICCFVASYLFLLLYG